MAKTPVNKTKAVRDVLSKNRDASPTEIVEALEKQGITISIGHASNIKSKLKKWEREGKGTLGVSSSHAAGVQASGAAGEARPGDTVTLEQIKKVAQMVRSIGGFDRLKELLEVMRELGGLRQFRELLEAMSLTDSDPAES